MSVAKATNQRPPLPPFTRETAIEKVRLAEDAWNSRDPEKVALAYTVDSRWRNRSEFVNGRQEIVAFLRRKWAKELDYRLIKELWAFEGSRVAVRFAYEWHAPLVVSWLARADRFSPAHYIRVVTMLGFVAMFMTPAAPLRNDGKDSVVARLS